MDFYRFFNILENIRIVGDTDPTTVAGAWKRLAPTDRLPVEMNELWRLVMAVSDPARNRSYLEIVALGSRPKDLEVYKNRINALLNLPGLLGTVTGKIVDYEKADFHCRPRTNMMSAALGDKGVESHVLIAPPPLEYGKDDLALLSSIVVHELRHAADFHETDGAAAGAEDYYRDKLTIDIDLYARNILECRAHADQVRHLVETMGGGEKARRVLVESVLARALVPRLRDSMLELVDLLCARNESWEPPAVVARSEDHVGAAVELVRGICESFRLSRFVRNPRAASSTSPGR